jgi:hypothetical protein
MIPGNYLVFAAPRPSVERHRSCSLAYERTGNAFLLADNRARTQNLDYKPVESL